MAAKKARKSAAKKETAVEPLTTESVAPAIEDGPLPEIDKAAEKAKTAGQTDSQQAVKKYHEGSFQTHDPVTGLERDKPLPQ
jgi:hypothetical protein